MAPAIYNIPNAMTASRVFQGSGRHFIRLTYQTFRRRVFTGTSSAGLVLVMNVKYRPLPHSLLLLAIGLIDLVTTILLVETGLCRELNPLMAPLLNQHWLVFALVKSLTLVVAFAAGEWYRKRDERFVKLAMSAGAITYLVVWVFWFVSGWNPMGV
jgi:hypothetical protein